MSEIEKTREELKIDANHVNAIRGQVIFGYSLGKLEGFNLGVQLAHKEFLDKIDSLIDYIDTDADIRKEFRWKHFKIDFEKFKQQLKDGGQQ